MEATEESMEVGHEDLSHIVKGKRTKRHRQSSVPAMASSTSDDRVMASPAATTSTGEFSYITEEDEDMANCLILLAQSGGDVPKRNSPGEAEAGADARAVNFVSKRGPDLYECKTCSKCFPSFQALGGHRASHKKPKNGEEKEKAVAAAAGEEEGFRLFKEASMSVVMQQQQGGAKAGGKPKVHECSICGSEFTSGQALGGHMRRHRIVSELPDSKKPKNALTLDLNLPAPDDQSEPAAEFSDFTTKPTVMFPALVDCHN